MSGASQPETLYKVLNSNGSARIGTGSWPLPKNGKPGAWLSVKGELVPCENGLHLCREQDLLHWLGPAIWIAEAAPRSTRVVNADKVVVRKARLVFRVEHWTREAQTLFAADCAEHVLHLFEHERPDDDRPRKAIEAARAWVTGAIAARAARAARAAADAAYAAADAAYDAEAAWQQARLMEYLRGEVEFSGHGEGRS